MSSVPEPTIRITRSAGPAWGVKFSPATPTTDAVPTTLADVQSLVQGAGGNQSAYIPPRTLTDASLDVSIDNLAPGDVLRYSDNKWRNYSEINLTDGGNF